MVLQNKLEAEWENKQELQTLIDRLDSLATSVNGLDSENVADEKDGIVDLLDDVVTDLWDYEPSITIG
ncbi:hypothetical protein LOOC260_109580 [Paucilactobacillus hokkaidonensis JCM 18461]|uniref:Uncharacterized protein n=2 Tax=Paucilactobacillus hokkaidonensis TaxID=1193095 RepID=A0A0A1GT68_9LACO|nr:hypothetical protein [Paucilactobacillus hokkaidonensis]KRO07682.1 hypothetical protein IV59_GL001774 [Paucilactobacillus hokkaidonensis]BAP85497.1 hypothetical protein LOOC260_109580 [Paucilactobacillus hokkaidonensis JCM 18461]